VLASLTKKYRHKIKTPDELVALIGPRPRQKKAIMCHGVFDVVHPGHLRHLLYAKSKAEILVVSITADRHITKGENRPHVPQDLRALNLAAFEMVDYVIIDAESTPIRNIQKLQPDLFAKGYEYTAGAALSPKTHEEIEALHSYGGEILFTPGDIVYSSSHLIDLAPPTIKLEKLLTLMDSEGVTFEALKDCLPKLQEKKVHVVGDTIVDSYTRTAVIGSSTKTPTLSVQFESRTDYVGGAAIVAQHLHSAGARVSLSTVLGDDPLGGFVQARMKEVGIRCLPAVDPTRPTTNKNVIVSEGYRLLKVDTLDNRTITDSIVETLACDIDKHCGDAVVFSDFRHGIFNRRTIPRLVSAIPAGVFKVADSQVASRWGNITEFSGFDLITPNEREARFAVGDQDSGVRPLASMVYDKAKCRTLILKMGSRGVLTCRSASHEEIDSFFVVESFADRIMDGVGAGDALLAYATLTLLATGSEVMATIVGSMAAACECERDGNIPITPEDVLQKIDALERQAHYTP